MKIREDDFLWKMYLRYYKDCEIVEPKSICPYFWKAMCGLVMFLFADVAFYIMFPLVVALTIGYGFFIVEGMKGVQSGWIIFPVIAGMMVLLVSALILCVVRWVGWMESRTLKTRNSIFLATMIPMIMFAGYHIIGTAKWNPDWSGLLQGLTWMGITWGGIIGAIALYHLVFRPAAASRFGKQILMYLGAVKRGVCPMVEAPDSFKKEKQ
jgi:hypothetical protein